LQRIRSLPVFLYLLPVFFVFHGYVENFDFVPVPDALKLTLIYLVASAILSLVLWPVFKDFRRANLTAFAMMTIFLFFGFIHDSLKKIFPGTFMTQYRFLLPLAGLLIIFVILALKKRKRPLRQLTLYLNTLFVILLILDIGWLVTRTINKKDKTIAVLPAGLNSCAECPRPDVYLIISDEYAGNTALKDIFQFDDSNFISQLGQRGFQVIPDSYSNYNYTPFSIASMLDMRYLELEDRNRTQPDLTYCYETIRDSRMPEFFRYHGYDFYNYSVFDFTGQPARTNESFLPAKTRLITSQTLFSRLYRDLAFNLISKLRSKKMVRRATYMNLRNNERLFDLTMKIATDTQSGPKFVYTHLMMPHYPYYFDKNGNERPFTTLVEGNQHQKEAYIGYLQYANGKLLQLIDHIFRASPKPPVILLLGDHGFRHFREPVAEKYYFLNLSAVFLPSKNYDAFPDSSSAVNIVREVLNTEFKQQLPRLKDSTSYLRD
jgi:hypothetical protein